MKNKYTLIIIGCMLFITSMGITYAAFQTNLHLVGSVKNYAYLWPAGVAPVTPTSSGASIGKNGKSQYLGGAGATSDRLTLNSESYDTNTSTYTLLVNKSYTFLQSLGGKVNFPVEFTFVNKSNYILTNGAVAITERDNDGLLDVPTGSLSCTTLRPGESCTLSMAMNQKIYGTYSGNKYPLGADYDITFTGGNNETMHVYVKITFSGT